MKEIAKVNGIDVPKTVIYNFDAILIEEAKTIPGYEIVPILVMNNEIVPISVMNILMEYSRNHVLSMFNINATR